jgi:HAD superfamily hydrolase (TIGR01459 family)
MATPDRPRDAAAIPVLRGLAEVVDRYQALIVDLWGVIHGGVEPYPGVVPCLRALAEAGKPVALLSNAPRRSATAGRRLAEMGIARELYRFLLTSGDSAHDALAGRDDPDHAALGRRFHYIGPGWDADLVEDLDYVAVPDAAEADFLLCVGLIDESDPLERYDPTFEVAARRGAPMLCVNPDLVVHRQGGVTSPCAGMLAKRFAERYGGRVIDHGKPDPAIFHRAARQLGAGEAVLVVGDSLSTDIKGANAAGFESVFVTRGIFAAELGIEPGAEPDPGRVGELAVRYGERPTYALATLRW